MMPFITSVVALRKCAEYIFTESMALEQLKVDERDLSKVQRNVGKSLPEQSDSFRDTLFPLRLLRPVSAGSRFFGSSWSDTGLHNVGSAENDRTPQP